MVSIVILNENHDNGQWKNVKKLIYLLSQNFVK